jgi:hypothetical protein
MPTETCRLTLSPKGGIPGRLAPPHNPGDTSPAQTFPSIRNGLASLQKALSEPEDYNKAGKPCGTARLRPEPPAWRCFLPRLGRSCQQAKPLWRFDLKMFSEPLHGVAVRSGRRARKMTKRTQFCRPQPQTQAESKFAKRRHTLWIQKLTSANQPGGRRRKPEEPHHYPIGA